MSLNGVGKLSRTLFALIAFLVTTVMIQGCLEGNGEGVGQKFTRDEDPSPPSDPTSDGMKWDVGNFYDLNPLKVNLSCSLPAGTKTGPEIKIEKDRTIRFSDNCNGLSRLLTMDQIDFSFLWPILGYESGIYESLGPSSTHVEVFCLSESSQQMRSEEFVVHAGGALARPSGSAATKNEHGWNVLTEEVQISSLGALKTYQANRFTLNIDLGSTSLLPDEYPGILQIQGENSSRNMHCRVIR